MQTACLPKGVMTLPQLVEMGNLLLEIWRPIVARSRHLRSETCRGLILFVLPAAIELQNRILLVLLLCLVVTGEVTMIMIMIGSEHIHDSDKDEVVQPAAGCQQDFSSGADSFS